MELTKRQCAILAILLRGPSETTLGAIAAELGVSARTVHRELARLAAPLWREYGLSLSGRSGHGLRVVGSEESVAACRSYLDGGAPGELDAEDRRRMLALLLLDAPDALKTFALTHELDTTTAGVKRDLDVLRPWFGLYGLQLTSRKGLGVRLDGAEGDRRQALCSIIMEHYGEAGFLALLRGDGEARASRQKRLVGSGDPDRPGGDPGGADDPVALVFGRFPPEPFREAERALSGLARSVLPALAPRDYLGLVIHLGVASIRRRQGYRLESRATAGGDEAGSMTEFDTEGVARAVVEAMAGAGALPAEPEEARSVERFLRGAKPERAAGGAPDSGIGSIAGAMALIDECGRDLGLDFSADRLLRDGLAAHWGPALYRVRNRLPIVNPMLARIVEQYPTLFASIKTACARVFTDLAVPDDEIGYLVLHFGAAIARGRSGGERFRALVVCSAGIGSARMLASRIHAELPEIEIVANLSWLDVGAVPRDRWDVLVSTIPLPLGDDEYVLVDPLLSAEGLAAIRSRLADRRRGGDAPGLPAPGQRGDGTLSDLKSRSRQLQAVIGVLERLTVYRDACPGDDWEAVLAAAIDRCAGSGLVRDSAAALRDLRERSRDFGILLPASRVLFLHARSEGVSASSLSLHAFADGVPSGAGSWDTEPTRLALMLAPRSLDRETQDILNEISVSLLDAGTVEILQAADETAIRNHYSRYLDRYFRSIPPQGA